MGKLKEKLLNGLTESEMDELYGISSFEYVELVERYKNRDDSQPPTEEEFQKMKKEADEYYNSAEFQKYVDEYYNPDDVWNEEMEKQFLKEQPPYPFATDVELDAINESTKVKYTDNDILYVLDGLAGPTLKSILMDRLNDVWNTKNGVV